ncbi:hypothetical protein FGIG_12494 [Fasciola gigantica]|uniref:Adenylate kinase 8 n=1 Tax=Fasciola gigantica TaxID=46835 RepID=A0A504YPQ8_FASGI|nr:hypothetical protein FGIG_12494 [Fasciola gigantica]
MISVISEDRKPIRIPPEYVQYADKHSIFRLAQNLLKALIIDRPDDPLSYLIEYLEKNYCESSSLFILGPAYSGKRTLAELLAFKLKRVVLTADEIFKLVPEAQVSGKIVYSIEICLGTHIFVWEYSHKCLARSPRSKIGSKPLRNRSVFGRFFAGFWSAFTTTPIGFWEVFDWFATDFLSGF